MGLRQPSRGHRMLSRRLSSLVFTAAMAAVCVSSPTRAEAPNCGAVSDSRSNVFIKLLMTPPCDICEETKAELKELNDIQDARTQAEVDHAKADITISLQRFLDGAEIKFDAAALDKCGPFFDKLSKLTKEAGNNAKNTFCRTRPYKLSGSTLQALQSVDDLKNSPSYPSGHTTYGTLIGTVLAQMLPEKRDQLYARISDYGHSRMIAGVHYRSDVDAGKILGAAIAADEFAKDEEFKAAFPGATACVRGALGLQDQTSPAQEATVRHP
jgi:acid phosphatase (class A)